jgi:hypothetical protein
MTNETDKASQSTETARQEQPTTEQTHKRGLGGARIRPATNRHSTTQT